MPTPNIRFVTVTSEPSRLSMSCRNFFLWWKFSFSVCCLDSVLVSEWRFSVCWLVFCGVFQHSLWCASMLLSVTFGDVGCSAGKVISNEEGDFSL